ncbi:MAG TPA: TIGR04053 family radical SAM/SPASM domain-containing protein, partial [Candidatus Dormibacteraeota bacterium]|nr:TIGR04053 family radical SAM/SPASM domain-containing protein [Candidatus Dormibacteraeota bacterium]
MNGAGPAADFATRPLLVFWETTRACELACRHCRASATPAPLPGELTPQEGRRLLQDVADFGRPRPILILTGGDCLMRPDLFQLVGHAGELGLPVAVSPSVTPSLTRPAMARLRGLGVKVASISLDGAGAATHDAVRGVPGHFDQTLAAIRALVAEGFKVQVNTTVMRDNVEELAEVAALVQGTGAAIWEVFFLIGVGRGAAALEIGSAEAEDVCHFLVDASRYGFLVRTVEAPFFRRVLAWRRAAELDPAASPFARGPLYEQLARRLRKRLGPPGARMAAPSVATRDGKGIIFVAFDGTVHPAGFLPLPLGNVRTDSLAALYRDHPVLRAIRGARFGGRCGVCEFRDRCGGSRARAFATFGDP